MAEAPHDGGLEEAHRMRNVAFVIVLAVLIGTLAGCWAGGADVRSDIQTISLGQQLIDLQKAHEAGAISQKEYERTKKRLLHD